jgi:hypothetical protein
MKRQREGRESRTVMNGSPTPRESLLSLVRVDRRAAVEEAADQIDTDVIQDGPIRPTLHKDEPISAQKR